MSIMNSYYCIQCEKLHTRSYSVKEKVFLSGFHYVNSILFNVGVCNKYISAIKNEK
ncbi:DUF3973 domain-containing protein [Paenibacillus aestuarii]